MKKNKKSDQSVVFCDFWQKSYWKKINEKVLPKITENDALDAFLDI